MFKKVLTALALCFLVLVIYISLKPADFTIQRSAVVHAPPSRVFPLINDLHQWARWSPYDKLDPAMKKTFAGPVDGPGASYSWDGNSKAGAGKITLLDATPGRLVHLKLEFVRPMAATDDAKFLLTPTPGGTQVTWVMTGKNGFLGKAAGTFINIDKMVGKDFEDGLANLDTAAQAK